MTYYLNESDISAAKTYHLASELGELEQIRGREDVDPAEFDRRYQAVAKELLSRDAPGAGPHRYTARLTVWQHWTTPSGAKRCSKIPTRKIAATAADIVTAIQAIVSKHHRPATPDQRGQTLLISRMTPPEIS